MRPQPHPDTLRNIRIRAMAKPQISVAVVDDDESVRKALCRLLHSAGIESEAFAGGEPFIQSLVRRTPDCVLLDVRMPDMDGEEVLERLDSMKCHIPVIVVTAHDEEAARCLVRFPNTVRVLPKPVDDRTLVGGIRSAVQAQWKP